MSQWRTHPLLACGSLLLACGVPPAARTDAGPHPDADPVAAMVDEVMLAAIVADAPDDLSTCVGAVVAVVTPGRSLVRGYGATSAGGAVAPDGDTIFQIGSISKVFTGLALARRVTEGHLAADDLVATRVEADLQAPLAGATFTLAQLVSHRAGFPPMPSNLVDRDLDGLRDVGIDPLSPAMGYSRADLVTYLDRDLPTTPPGSAYQYSNVGLGLAAIALEDQLGASGYDAVLRELVTDTLGMGDTWGQVGAMEAGASSRVAQGYALDGVARAPGRLGQMGVLAGSGEIVTTANDMLRFLGAVTGETPGALDGASALAVAPLASMPDGREVGFAFEVEHLAGGDRFIKGGNTTSYSAYLVFRRQPRVGVIVMTSCGGFARVIELATAIDEGLVR